MKLLNSILLCCFSVLLCAQDFEDLKAPAVPAANVFGYEANVIDRPQDPKVFASQLFGAVSSSRITPGLAIEVTPFFMKKRYDYTIENYLNDTVYGRRLASGISLSLATSQTDTIVYGNLDPGTGISGGFRMLLVGGKFPEELDSMRTALAAYTTIIPALISSIITDLPSTEMMSFSTVMALIDRKIDSNSEEELEIAYSLKKLLREKLSNPKAEDSVSVQAINDILTEDMVNGFSNVSNYIADISLGLKPSARTGHMLELSGAFSGVFQDNEYKGAAFGRAQLWLTYSYRAAVKEGKKDVYMDAMAIARVTLNNIDAGVDDGHFVDVGIKGQAKIRRCYISVELVGRYTTADVPDTKPYTYRIAGNIEYQINELLGVFLTFGRNFDGNSTTFDPSSAGSVLSVAGLNLGLNGARK